MLISNFALKKNNMNIYCCCLQKYVNKLIKIQNQPRSQLPTGIIGTKLTLWKMLERSVYNILHGRKSEE